MPKINFPKLLGIYAPREQSGKSTVAALLMDVLGPENNVDVVKVKITEPLKAPLYAIGLTTDEIEGEAKNLPCAKLGGRVPRAVMIEFYQAGSKAFGPGWLSALARDKVLEAIAAGYTVVVDDIRTPTDYAMVRSVAGAQMWRVERPRPGESAVGDAAKVEGLLEAECFDTRLLNDGSLTDLYQKVRDALAS